MSLKEADQASSSGGLRLFCTHLCQKDARKRVEATVCLFHVDDVAVWGSLVLLPAAQIKCRGV